MTRARLSGIWKNDERRMDRKTARSREGKNRAESNSSLRVNAKIRQGDRTARCGKPHTSVTKDEMAQYGSARPGTG